MKKYLAVAGIAAALALAVALGVASNGDDSPPTAAGPELVAPDLVAGTDDLRSDDPRTEGDVNGELDEAGGLPPVEELPELESEEDRPDTPRGDRSAFLEDLRSAIESRAEELGERVVDLTEQRSLGEDIAEGVALLVDEVTVLGESIITGVAITPEALEAVPDLREKSSRLLTMSPQPTTTRGTRQQLRCCPPLANWCPLRRKPSGRPSGESRTSRPG